MHAFNPALFSESGKTMRRIIAIIILGTTLIGAAYGAAASVDVNGGTIQAGASGSLTCQPAGRTLATQYKTAWVAKDKLVTGVKASGFDPACEGKTAQIDLLNAAGLVLGSAGGTIHGSETDWLPVAAGVASPKVLDVVTAFFTVGDVSR
jgi:hypothetical protein